jgi:hypothetical protein
MGLRGELFSSKATVSNRSYFFNVKENRLGDLFMTLVESKPNEGEGFERHQVVVFADDVREFLKGFEESLRFMESEVGKRRRDGHGKPEGRSFGGRRDDDRRAEKPDARREDSRYPARKREDASRDARGPRDDHGPRDARAYAADNRFARPADAKRDRDAQRDSRGYASDKRYARPNEGPRVVGAPRDAGAPRDGARAKFRKRQEDGARDGRSGAPKGKGPKVYRAKGKGAPPQGQGDKDNPKGKRPPAGKKVARVRAIKREKE